MADVKAIAATLHGLVQPGMTRKDVIAAVRQRFPDTTKKAIKRAALHALIAGMDGDAERALRLQEYAASALTTHEA